MLYVEVARQNCNLRSGSFWFIPALKQWNVFLSAKQFKCNTRCNKMYDSANKCNIWETRSLSLGVWSVLYEVMCTDPIWESKEATSTSNFFYLQNIVIKCDTGMYSEISIKLWSKMRFGVEMRWTNTESDKIRHRIYGQRHRIWFYRCNQRWTQYYVYETFMMVFNSKRIF